MLLLCPLCLHTPTPCGCGSQATSGFALGSSSSSVLGLGSLSHNLPPSQCLPVNTRITPVFAAYGMPPPPPQVNLFEPIGLWLEVQGLCLRVAGAPGLAFACLPCPWTHCP